MQHHFLMTFAILVISLLLRLEHISNNIEHGENTLSFQQERAPLLFNRLSFSIKPQAETQKCCTRQLQNSDFSSCTTPSRSAQLFMHSYLHSNKHTYLNTLIMETWVHSAAAGKHFPYLLMRQTHRLDHATLSSSSLSNIRLIFFEARGKLGTSATAAN